jgi:hypothetical protein
MWIGHPNMVGLARHAVETPFSTAQHIGSEFPQCGAEHKVAFKAESIVYGGTAKEATCEFSRFEL